MCSGSEAGSYLRLIDFGFGVRTYEQLKREGTARRRPATADSSMSCRKAGGHDSAVRI